MASETDRKTLNERWDKVTIGSSQLLAEAVNEEAKASFVYVLFKASIAVSATGSAPELPPAAPLLA